MLCGQTGIQGKHSRKMIFSRKVLKVTRLHCMIMDSSIRLSTKHVLLGDQESHEVTFVFKKAAAGSASLSWRKSCLVSSFFLLSFFCHGLTLITSTVLNRFWPNLVTTTLTPTPTCHVTPMGSKVIWGSQGSKMWFSLKSFQVLRVMLHDHVTHA